MGKGVKKIRWRFVRLQFYKVTPPAAVILQEFYLSQNYPNPLTLCLTLCRQFITTFPQYPVFNL